MPASTGIVLDGLWPPGPWQALQTSALGAPGVSNGPAQAAPASVSTKISVRMVGIARSLSAGLAEHVVPDAGRPPDRVLRPLLRLAGGELLLDLHDLAALDLVRVDDRDRFPVADPAVARVARCELQRLLAVQEVHHRERRDLAHRVGDVARLRYRQPDRRVADDVDALVLRRLVRDVVDLAPPLVGADEV